MIPIAEPNYKGAHLQIYSGHAYADTAETHTRENVPCRCDGVFLERDNSMQNRKRHSASIESFFDVIYVFISVRVCVRSAWK